jgi:hypothetical protein
MKVYVLIAEGWLKYFPSSARSKVCRKAFTLQSEAESEIPAFLDRAKKDRGGLKEFDPDTVSVWMAELDLV